MIGENGYPETPEWALPPEPRCCPFPACSACDEMESLAAFRSGVGCKPAMTTARRQMFAEIDQQLERLPDDEHIIKAEN